MRYVLPLILFVSLAIILFTTALELADTRNSTQSIYRKEASPFFLLDRDSSFYHTYSLIDPSPYLLKRKLGHFIAYGIISAILFLVLPTKSFWLKSFQAFSSATVIGLIDEIYQYFLMNRSGLFLDVLVNAAGSFTSITILLALYMVFELGKRLSTLVSNHRNLKKKTPA